MKLKVPITENLPDGLYQGRLFGIEERESDTGPYLRWSVDIEYKGDTVKRAGNTSASFGPKSKAYRWATALLGRRPRAGEEIDADKLAGRPCLVQITTTEGPDGGFNRIEAILPGQRDDQDNDADFDEPLF
jgi:hypothetical protein